MIIPSIDIREGRAVQLRQGRELVLDGGDPMERLEEFSVAGEVAVIDLDAALGRGSNAELIRRMVRRAPCRVGGGIRNEGAVLEWLDAGAERVLIGTAATPELCRCLPRHRVIAAVDARCGEIVVDGWRERTGIDVIDKIRELAPYVGGFLLTQVEHEGEMGGFDIDRVAAAVRAAGAARVVAAGGVRNAEEIATLDHLGADAQVGMAIYSGALSLGESIAAPLERPMVGSLWPTVVCDERGTALGLVWSTRESVRRAVEERRGIYWSRSRRSLWRKGETSGAIQELLRIDLDCDRDALRFVVRQRGVGFCHREERSCWPSRFDIGSLERLVAGRAETPEPGSGTAKLLADPALLESKLVEEARELAAAQTATETASEAADLLYFLTVALSRRGVDLEAVERVLEFRNRRVRRRPMEAKPDADGVQS